MKNKMAYIPVFICMLLVLIFMVIILLKVINGTIGSYETWRIITAVAGVAIYIIICIFFIHKIIRK